MRTYTVRFCDSHNVKCLLAAVEEYYTLPAGWDNESNEKTSPACLDRLKDFVHHLANNHDLLLPEESMGTGDEVALYWDVLEGDEENSFYYIIHFYPDYFRAYYAKGDESDSFIGDYTEGYATKLLSIIPTRQEIFGGAGC